MKKTFICSVCICLILLFAGSACVSALADEPVSTLNMRFCDQVFRLQGVLPRGTKSAAVYDTPDLSGKPSGHLYPDMEITVLGGRRKCWHVSSGDIAGYITRSKVVLTGVPEGSSPISSIVRRSTLVLDPTMVRPRDEDYIFLKGALELSGSVESVSFFIWDEWQQKVESVAIWTPEQSTASLNAEEWQKVLPTKGLTGGRKMLCIQGNIGNSAEVLARIPFFVAGKVNDPANITDKCTIVPFTDRLLDARVASYWSPTEKRKELTVTLPEDGSAALIQMEWFAPPEQTVVTVRDKDERILLEDTISNGFYVDAIHLTQEARSVTIRPTGRRVRMSSLRVYAEDYPREVVQQWEPMPEKLDMLLFSTHQDDEILFFSGAVPWYSHLGKKVGIVYMTNCGRDRYKEALDGIWLAGMRIHPVFLGYPDKDISSMKVANGLWPDGQEAVVRQIRRAKPDVVLVQDINGEYGHTQHQLMSELVRKGVELASDPAFDPESAEEYGTWDVKKLYVHLYGEKQIHMDWKIPLEECGGFTPWDIAVEAFEMHHSQYGYFRMERQSIIYDSSLFGLYKTSVGDDTPGTNDMFEHINP